jgi:hypothetical protein
VRPVHAASRGSVSRVLPALAAALLAATALAAAGSPAAADGQGTPLGKLYLSFSPDSPVHAIEIDPMVPFSWYVVAEVDFTDIGDPDRNGTDGVLGWETCIEVPPEITITGREVLRPGFNGADASCAENWIVVLEGCLWAEDTPQAVVRYQGRLDAEATNVEVSLAPASPSSIEGEVPGWFVCLLTGQPTDVHPFASGWETPLVVNERVATGPSTWSAVKRRF